MGSELKHWSVISKESMQHDETLPWNDQVDEGLTQLQIHGNAYFTVNGIADKLGISRQTIWRWRQAGKIPAGHKYRDKWVVFTEEEYDEILRFSNRLEPIQPVKEPS